MSEPRILRFYLDDGLRQSAQDGDHNFIGKVATVVQNAGYRVEYCRDSQEERAKSAHRRGFSMFHMHDPFHDRALTIRRVYHYPFWAIERSAKRWEWTVAQTPFPATDTPPEPARHFYQFWQKRLFGDGPLRATCDGYVYVPLQGRLLDHRSFQHCSPIEMLTHLLKNDPKRPVVAALHPNEHYTDAEIKALNVLSQSSGRLSIRTGDMEALLRGCDYVVSQNSSAAFSALFFGKPIVLFGKIDFHHIAANVADLGPGPAIRTAPHMTPDYAGYLHWFWQIMSINAGRPEAEDQIRAALIRHGWPIK